MLLQQPCLSRRFLYQDAVFIGIYLLRFGCPYAVYIWMLLTYWRHRRLLLPARACLCNWASIVTWAFCSNTNYIWTTLLVARCVDSYTAFWRASGEPTFGGSWGSKRQSTLRGEVFVCKTRLYITWLLNHQTVSPSEACDSTFCSTVGPIKCFHEIIMPPIMFICTPKMFNTLY